MTAQITAENFLAGRINFERIRSMPNSEAALKLDRMRELLQRLGNPQNSLPIVHVAGTKGKGSTSAMIAAVLTAAGYRVGLFTSPHIERVEQRMAVDGRPCPPEEFAALVETVRPAVEAMDRAAAAGNPPELGPTYFEIITALALLHFSRRSVDAAVLEVGMGGRLDSTNVCPPRLSIITSISLDHTQQLGNTLESIAAEKAGIIKPGATVVSGVRDQGPREVIKKITNAAGCRLVELGVDFDFEYHPPRHLERAPMPAQFNFISPLPQAGERPGVRALKSKKFTLSLPGRHQAANAAVALAAIKELRRDGWTVPDAAIRSGLADVECPARVEVVSRRPAVVLDAAHNAASIEALVAVLNESFSVNRRILIFAATQDKDISGMLRVLLANFDHIIFTCYTNNPRGVPPEELKLSVGVAVKLPPQHSISPLPQAGEGPGVRAVTMEIAPTPADAWRLASRLAQPDDLICA
ncbi:MAG: bifunctional folylpolyglutamate synthase/dihydrofolate synthase, partial [Pirellulales bacterium]|nr:bifunctional folylpolyglutamate synthase/dihydrofolate synthase [Pirellulales bacterium]